MNLNLKTVTTKTDNPISTDNIIKNEINGVGANENVKRQLFRPVVAKDFPADAGNKNIPFQPQTPISFGSSIQVMLEVLKNITTTTQNSLSSLPPELQKQLMNILQNGFSSQSNLEQGLANLLQGQKASIDQTNILSKLLKILGNTINENSGETLNQTDENKLSPQLKTLLSNLKQLDNQGGKFFNTVNISKLATKNLENTKIFSPNQQPENILDNFNTTSGSDDKKPSVEMRQVLKVLIKEENQSVSVTENEDGDLRQDGGSKQTGRVIEEAKYDNKFIGTTNVPKNKPVENQLEGILIKKNSEDTEEATEIVKAQLPQEENRENFIKEKITLNPQQQNEKIIKDVVVGNADQELTTTNEKEIVNQDSKVVNAKLEQVEHSNNSVKSYNFLLEPKELNVLFKNLAQQLLIDKKVAPEQERILQKFIQSDGKLTDEDVSQLNKLLKLCNDFTPLGIKQVAYKNKADELPKLWVMAQLSELAEVANLPQEQLKASAKALHDFSTILRSAMQNENEVQGSQKSMSFMLPLYMGENEQSYPAYFHIYHEKDGGKNPYANQEYETWLRICLLTENIGAVEIVFRLYENDKLNLRVALSDDVFIKDFNENFPEVQNALQDMPFNLTDIRVFKISER